MTKPKVVAIVGATACGKSSLALTLAGTLNTEIVCMDSMQIYRYMDVGTAKPTRLERALTPHHMLDVVSPDQPFSVAQYTDMAADVIADVTARGRLPMLVGGTGLYLKSLRDGMRLGEAPSSPQIRERLNAVALQKDGKAALHGMLEKADPVTAARLHPNDARRVIRALEIYELTGAPMSAQQPPDAESRYDMLVIGLRMPKEALYPRIEKRVEQMMRDGLLEEVKSLLGRGVSPDAQAMQGIGYKELTPVILNGMERAYAVGQMVLHTRRYAKRQETWFKADRSVQWMEADGQSPMDALHRIRRFLDAEPSFCEGMRETKSIWK